MDLSLILPEGWVLLAASFVAAVIADHAIVKIGLDFLKPTSRYAFTLGRVGKLVAVTGWLVFFTSYWLPEHLADALPQGTPLPGWIPTLQWAIILGLAVLAFTTYPRYAVAKEVAAQKRGTHV